MAVGSLGRGFRGGGIGDGDSVGPSDCGDGALDAGSNLVATGRAFRDGRGLIAGRAEGVDAGAPETENPRPLRAAIRSFRETKTGSSSSVSAGAGEDFVGASDVTGGGATAGVGLALDGGVQLRVKFDEGVPPFAVGEMLDVCLTGPCV